MVGFSSPRRGDKRYDMETDDEDIEEPSFGRPHHGENCDAVPKLKEAQGRISFEVCNDLQVAIEVNPGTGWKVLYPEGRFCLDTLQPVDVAARLRDDPDICGTCYVGATALLRATEAFGHFGLAAVGFIEAEQREVEHERQLREARIQKLEDAIQHVDCNCRGCCWGLMIFVLVSFLVLFLLSLVDAKDSWVGLWGCIGHWLVVPVRLWDLAFSSRRCSSYWR